MSHNHDIGCTCSECHDHEHGEENRTFKIVQIIIAAVLLVAGFVVEHLELNQLIYIIIYAVAYLIVGAEVIFAAFKNLFKGNFFDETFLMSLATLSIFAVCIFDKTNEIAEYHEAVLVMLLYQIGELLQDYAVDKSHDSVGALLSMKEVMVHKIVSNKTEDFDINNIVVGDVIVVKPGEKIPLDGIIVKGSTTLDMSPLTGESIPINKVQNDAVLSGTINIDGLINIQVTSVYEDSTVSKILDCIEGATLSKTSSERFVTKFAKIYTPIVVCLAILVVAIPSIFFHEPILKWVSKASIFLVISCPCALVISVPLAYFIGIGVSSRKGVLMKGTNFIEVLNSMDTVVFDKTGTLTKGELRVVNVEAKTLNKKELVELAGTLEQSSTHPIAKALALYANNDVYKFENVSEISGKGIQGTCGDKFIEINNIRPHKVKQPKLGTTVYIYINSQYEGYVTLVDTLKDDARQAVDDLKLKGVKTVILSGDSKDNADEIGKSLGIENVHSELLPNDKVEVLDSYMKVKQGTVAFVGDGINDAPVIAKSDVGIAMGAKGSDAAVETSDIVVMNDSLTSIVIAQKISKATVRIVKENIIMIVVVKIAAMILGIFGLLTPLIATISDVGICLLAILNSLRLFKYSK